MRPALSYRGLLLAIALGGLAARGDEPTAPHPASRTQQELMAERGLVRHRGAWRTVQEIALIERAEKASLAQREWKKRLERLRRQLDQPAQADRAAEEIRGISDPAAVPSLTAALATEGLVRVRGFYVEALSHIQAQDALVALVALAIDHPDPETRIAAVERLAVIGPHLAVPPIAAALQSPDNARINRAAEALGRLGVPAAVAPLINALQTEHVTVQGDGKGEGSMSATFTPGGGGLAMGGGPKRTKVVVSNERVLEALVALTGANFVWDAAAWRAWLANRQSPPPDYDLRRG